MNCNSVMTVATFVLACSVPCLAQHEEWDHAWRSREVVGLAPTDLAALNVAPATQRQLAVAYREHVASPEADTRPLVALADALRAVGGEASWGRDLGDAFDQAQSRRADLILAMQPIAEAALADAPPDGECLVPYLLRAVANAGIDCPYRLLDLTEEQRAQILTRQEQRDQVLRDARQWHRVRYLESVQAQFAGDVRGLLTEGQRIELADFEVNIDNNLVAVWAVELEDYPLEEEGAAGKLDLPRMAKQLLADAREALRQAKSVAGQLAPWLAAWEPKTPPAVAKATPFGPDLGG